MINSYLEHPTEQALERFILKRSPEEELEVLETHILACESCVTRLENLELQIATLKAALADFETERIQKELAPARSSWKSWFTIPTLSWAGAAVAALAIGVAVLPHTAPHIYDLSANRGTEMVTMPEGKALDLRVATTDINQGSVEAEVVNEAGAPVWKGQAAINNEKADVQIPEIAQAGTYFLRFYSSNAIADHELLREYRFEVK